MSDVSCPRGLIFKRNEDGTYVPFFVKVRENDIIWSSASGDGDGGNADPADYDSLLAYFLDILKNYVRLDEVTDWDNATPSSLNVTFTSPVKSYTGESIGDATWTTAVDNNYAFTSTTTIPITLDIFNVDEDNNALVMDADALSYVVFPISSLKDSANIQVSLICNEEGAIENIMQSSTLSTTLFYVEDDDVTLNTGCSIQILNSVYTFTEDAVKDALTDSDGNNICYISITVAGKGYNDGKLHAGTYSLSSSSASSTNKIDISNAYDSDDSSVSVTSDTYITFTVASDCSKISIAYEYDSSLKPNVYVLNSEGEIVSVSAYSPWTDDDGTTHLVLESESAPVEILGGSGNVDNTATLGYGGLPGGLTYYIYGRSETSPTILYSITVA